MEAEAAVVAAEAVEAVLPADKTPYRDTKRARAHARVLYYIYACRLMGGKHVLRVEQFVQLLFAQDTVLQHQVVHALACLQRLFGDLGRSLVADNGIEGGDDTDGVLDGL